MQLTWIALIKFNISPAKIEIVTKHINNSYISDYYDIYIILKH